MVRCVFIALFACLFLCAGSAQAILTAGDIAIVGYNSTTTDPAFAWIALRDIQSGEVIRFTDNKWLDTGGFDTREGTIEFTAPAGGVPAGTVTKHASPPGNTPPIFQLGEHGDQIIAYQDDGGTVVPLYGLSYDSFEWVNRGTTTTTSSLPPGLENANVAVYEIRNGEFRWDTLPDGATPAQWLTAIGNRDNWRYNSGTAFDFEPPGPLNVILPMTTEPDDGDEQSGGGSAVPTPEPATMLLASLFGLTLASRRRARQGSER